MQIEILRVMDLKPEDPHGDLAIDVRVTLPKTTEIYGPGEKRS